MAGLRERSLLQRWMACRKCACCAFAMHPAFAGKSPAAIRRGLYTMKKIEAMSFEESMSFTESQIALFTLTEDAKEGQAAFFGLGALAGIITVAIAIGQLAFAYGAWSLQPWAWSLGMVLALASIVWSVLLAVTSGDIVNGLISQAISIAISGVIIYYLNTPNVKAAFGKTAA